MIGRLFALNGEHQRKLSHWAVLKSIVNEYTVYPNPVCSGTECKEFMRNHDPSDKWGVWIARCQSDLWRVRVMSQQATMRLQTLSVSEQMETPGNVRFTTIALNELLIQVRLNAQDAVKLPSVPLGLFQIWPIGNSISWPPLKILNGTEAEEIGTSLLRFAGQWPPGSVRTAAPFNNSYHCRAGS
jgi:hypothetical protein